MTLSMPLYIIIADAGHHVDLMFSTKDDTAPIQEARAFELTQGQPQWSVG